MALKISKIAFWPQISQKLVEFADGSGIYLGMMFLLITFLARTTLEFRHLLGCACAARSSIISSHDLKNRAQYRSCSRGSFNYN